MKKTKKTLLSLCEMRLTGAKDSLAQWKKKFSEDPFNALEWADGVYRDAARVKIYSKFEELLKLPEEDNFDIKGWVYQLGCNTLFSCEDSYTQSSSRSSTAIYAADRAEKALLWRDANEIINVNKGE